MIRGCEQTASCIQAKTSCFHLYVHQRQCRQPGDRPRPRHQPLQQNIGLAIMGEVPLVIVDAQRMGPATGGATTPGQGDVQFVRWGTSGGYPIIALAPDSVASCYSLTLRAFDLAERFRVPVFLLTDKEMFCR
jgi:hypothetical protein